MQMGIATQCLKSSKCRGAKAQYFANVCLKCVLHRLYLSLANRCVDHAVHRINVKMGGINTIPEPRSIPILTDEKVPTIVMGVSVQDFFVLSLY